MTFIPPNQNVIKENMNPTPEQLQKANDEYLAKREKKPIHAKPSLYAHIYEGMKEIAYGYGYNLLIHGSMNRDLDLLAVPWFPNFTFAPNREAFIEALRKSVGGTFNDGHGYELSPGRYSYVINLNRRNIMGVEHSIDAQWYIDISVMASFTEMRDEIIALKKQVGELLTHG